MPYVVLGTLSFRIYMTQEVNTVAAIYFTDKKTEVQTWKGKSEFCSEIWILGLNELWYLGGRGTRRGTWVSPLVKHPILDFDSGHDLTVHGFKSCIGFCTDSLEPAWDSFSLCHSAPPPTRLCVLSLKRNK